MLWGYRWMQVRSGEAQEVFGLWCLSPLLLSLPLWLLTNWVENMNENIPPPSCAQTSLQAQTHTTHPSLSLSLSLLYPPPPHIISGASSLLFNIVCTFLRKGLEERRRGAGEGGLCFYFFFHCLLRSCGSLEREGKQGDTLRVVCVCVCVFLSLSFCGCVFVCHHLFMSVYPCV